MKKAITLVALSCGLLMAADAKSTLKNQAADIAGQYLSGKSTDEIISDKKAAAQKAAQSKATSTTSSTSTDKQGFVVEQATDIATQYKSGKSAKQIATGKAKEAKSSATSKAKSKAKDTAAEQIDKYVDSGDESTLVKGIVKSAAKTKANEKIDETFKKVE